MRSWKKAMPWAEDAHDGSSIWGRSSVGGHFLTVLASSLECMVIGHEEGENHRGQWRNRLVIAFGGALDKGGSVGGPGGDGRHLRQVPSQKGLHGPWL